MFFLYYKDTRAVKLMCNCHAFDDQKDVKVKFCEKLKEVKSGYYKWFEERSSLGMLNNK